MAQSSRRHWLKLVEGSALLPYDAPPERKDCSSWSALALKSQSLGRGSSERINITAGRRPCKHKHSRIGRQSHASSVHALAGAHVFAGVDVLAGVHVSLLFVLYIFCYPKM